MVDPASGDSVEAQRHSSWVATAAALRRAQPRPSTGSVPVSDGDVWESSWRGRTIGGDSWFDPLSTVFYGEAQRRAQFITAEGFAKKEGGSHRHRERRAAAFVAGANMTTIGAEAEPSVRRMCPSTTSQPRVARRRTPRSPAQERTNVASWPSSISAATRLLARRATSSTRRMRKGATELRWDPDGNGREVPRLMLSRSSPRRGPVQARQRAQSAPRRLRRRGKTRRHFTQGCRHRRHAPRLGLVGAC